MERADDVSCLREPGERRNENTCVDRQVGQPIAVLGPRNMIGQTFYGPTSSTDDINTFRPLNFLIAIEM